MPKFIELHISSTGIPININVDTIAYFMEMRGIVYLTVPVAPETGLGNITDDYSYVTTTPPTDMTTLYSMMLGYVVK